MTTTIPSFKDMTSAASHPYSAPAGGAVGVLRSSVLSQADIDLNQYM